MENREILIANTKTQKRNKIVTDATTLRELKVALTNAGIDYSGMTFTEGISKIQLLDDNSPLPQNVMYKGQETNNLVILLTNTKKNIASGEGSRAEAYAVIKENGLQEAIKEEFGTNYTLVKTESLWEFINNNTCDCDDSEGESCCCDDTLPEDEDDYTDSTDEIVGGIIDIIGNLYHQKVFCDEDLLYIKANIEAWLGENLVTPEPVSTSDGNITDDDIDDMIDEINGIN